MNDSIFTNVPSFKGTNPETPYDTSRVESSLESLDHLNRIYAIALEVSKREKYMKAALESNGDNVSVEVHQVADFTLVSLEAIAEQLGLEASDSKEKPNILIRAYQKILKWFRTAWFKIYKWARILLGAPLRWEAEVEHKLADGEYMVPQSAHYDVYHALERMEDKGNAQSASASSQIDSVAQSIRKSIPPKDAELDHGVVVYNKEQISAFMRGAGSVMKMLDDKKDTVQKFLDDGTPTIETARERQEALMVIRDITFVVTDLARNVSFFKSAVDSVNEKNKVKWSK